MWFTQEDDKKQTFELREKSNIVIISVFTLKHTHFQQ